MQRYTLLKLFGLVLLTQVILVAISFAEVFVYSTAVNPGKEVAVYDAHAMDSAPWISGIFGFIVFFLVSRYWTRKQLPNALKLALLFPLVYVVWDFLVILLFGVPDWLTYLPIFLGANVAKFLGSLGGHYLSKG
ncbi:MAG: hypothetical protein JNL40_13785 [Cyclobacteriaceae bacterium]|nr:hypothetical protein [Cyclobacteriaceae bacterium]